VKITTFGRAMTSAIPACTPACIGIVDQRVHTHVYAVVLKRSTGRTPVDALTRNSQTEGRTACTLTSVTSRYASRVTR
jgi:hypothetical protein